MAFKKSGFWAAAVNPLGFGTTDVDGEHIAYSMPMPKMGRRGLQN